MADGLHDHGGAVGDKQNLEATFRPTLEVPQAVFGAMVWVEMRGGNSRGVSPWADPFCIRVP